MGALTSRVFAALFGTKEIRIMMIGLDAAGKTTILYKLKLGKVETTIPTIGFNVETVQQSTAMGALSSRLFGAKEIQMMMIGLDGAGKTTILYKLKLGRVETTIPTVGHNIETVPYKNIDFTISDAGGHPKIRPLWRMYFHDKHAFIFVVVSNDVERLDEAAQDVKYVLSVMEERAERRPLLVFANKQDLPHAVGVDELRDKLKLRAVRQPCHVQATCATTGHGLYEGLDWLANALRRSERSD